MTNQHGDNDKTRRTEKSEYEKGGRNMKSQAVQELVRRIFSDEKTKLKFMLDPDSVLTQFDLTEQEKRAVLNTHAKLGLVTGDSAQLEAAVEPTINWAAPVP